MPRSVLIVDDHPGFRSMAGRLLAAAGYVVVAEAPDAAGALRAVSEHRPDCVLLDVGLPDADGLAVARAIGGGEDAPAVVLTSSRPAADLGALVADSPARGFLPKERLSAAALAALWG